MSRRLSARSDGEPLSYDRRRRGTTVEIDPVTAVSEIERLLHQLDRAHRCRDRHVTLSAVVDAGLPAVTMQSTIAREIAFVQLHAVHHCASSPCCSSGRDAACPTGSAWRRRPRVHGTQAGSSTAMIGTALALIAGTLVSEDATSVLAGVLIHRGEISWPAGVAACAAGIFLGDLGLWLVGRLGWAPGLALEDRARRDSAMPQQLRAGAWFADNAATLIVSSRFVPGTRLPLYLAAGAIGGSFGRFAVWSLVAVSLWTPLVVLAAAGGLTLVSPALGGLTEGLVDPGGTRAAHCW